MMIRPFTLFCALFAGVSGMVLYAQKHKTTQLDKEITKIVYDTQRIKSRTAMLRTEWTLLNQPDRLKDLSNRFIPNLRPLNPSQFVQMAAVTAVLPPVKIEPTKDKTREDLVKNVAQNNGQSAPIIVSQNTNTDASPTEQPKPQQTTKPVVITQNNNVTVESVRRKKVKVTEIADAADTIETQNLKPQTVKKVATITPKTNIAVEPTDSPAPVRRKKVKTTEIADATDAIEIQNLKPQTVKKNHIQNVSYNIQSDNPFSHNKASRAKAAPASQTNTNNNETTLEKKLSAKQAQQTSSNAPKKRPTAIKVARNEGKRSNYSESVLGGNTNEALPAPVPFTH